MTQYDLIRRDGIAELEPATNGPWVHYEDAKELEDLLRKMLDQRDCIYGEDGWCVRHGYARPCPHERARALIKS